MFILLSVTVETNLNTNLVQEEIELQACHISLRRLDVVHVRPVDCEVC